MAKAKTHEDLAAELRQVQAEIDRLNSPEQTKLTGEAFVAEAARISRRTMGEIEEIKRTLAADQGQTWPRSWALVLRLMRQYRTTHWPRPPMDANRLSFVDTGDAASEGWTLFELSAIAAAMAVELSPDSFGANENEAARETRVRQLEERREALSAELRGIRDRLKAEAAALQATAAGLGLD